MSLESITEIIEIKIFDDIPSDEYFFNLPRNKKIVLKFSEKNEHKRNEIGERFKEFFPNHIIGIHTISPEIIIRKLITREEIISNQDFFEKCAYDYRELATQLIFDLASHLKVDIHNEIPYFAFLRYWQKYKQKGRLGEWDFYFHGFHCCFTNRETKQYIEVSIVFGLEFGDLDPYFFTQYIKSSSKYYPLPIGIYEDYHDGARINQIMTDLGKFEKMNSDFDHHSGTVIKNRENKIETGTICNLRNETNKKIKFKFFKFLLQRLN
ncbi:DUF6896 domain-containing protein [Elizabethkingia occulta]|uniref:DUF6896 domain-containing protein n=1 Tax=Elizabethkingia occulta TaxID=1867263 RepID=A0A1T3M9H1_9FLAO|nr:hypothetical protein [Elizabethkingia occulta]OPB86408.1 hypothetical protein BB020_05670 [Elizabethkingia occulta]OPC61243.1 hypothetical protein BAZ10_12360 [Elizabethkingia occulta]